MRGSWTPGPTPSWRVPPELAPAAAAGHVRCTTPPGVHMVIPNHTEPNATTQEHVRLRTHVVRYFWRAHQQPLVLVAHLQQLHLLLVQRRAQPYHLLTPSQRALHPHKRLSTCPFCASGQGKASFATRQQTYGTRKCWSAWGGTPRPGRLQRRSLAPTPAGHAAPSLAGAAPVP